MRLKETSDALKRHRRTFHLARHNPERWEQERNITLSENLCDVRETTSKLEGEAEANKKLLECRQQQVGPVTGYQEKLRAHEYERLTASRRNWQLLKRRKKIYVRST